MFITYSNPIKSYFLHAIIVKNTLIISGCLSLNSALNELFHSEQKSRDLPLNSF